MPKKTPIFPGPNTARGAVLAVLLSNEDQLGSEPLRGRIFEPLFTTRVHGIGLGLAVSRRLTQQNGGELRHEVPDAGCGARFVLELPAMPIANA